MEVNEAAIAYSKQKVSIEEYLEIKAIEESILISEIYEGVKLTA